jgi:hypothetical protein
MAAFHAKQIPIFFLSQMLKELNRCWNFKKSSKQSQLSIKTTLITSDNFTKKRNCIYCIHMYISTSCISRGFLFKSVRKLLISKLGCYDYDSWYIDIFRYIDMIILLLCFKLWCSFVIFCGNSVYFSRIGTLYQEKSGNPGPIFRQKSSSLFLWNVLLSIFFQFSKYFFLVFKSIIAQALFSSLINFFVPLVKFEQFKVNILYIICTCKFIECD